MTKACLKRQARISSFILAIVIINSNDLSDSPFHDAYLASVAACFPIVPKLRKKITASKNDSLYTYAKIGAAVICVVFLIVSSIMLVDSTNNPFLYWNY